MLGKLLYRRQALSQSIKTNVFNLIIVANEKLWCCLWTCISKPILEFLRQIILKGTYLNKERLLESMTLDQLLSK